MKLLALCDSPTGGSGFSQVARELLTRFAPWFEQVDVWGINYFGERYDRAKFPFHIFPAAGQVQNTYVEWFHPARLTIMLNELVAGGYTHFWMLHDPSALTTLQSATSAPKPNGFAQSLKKLCDQRNIRSLYYFPVDAPMEKEWGAIVDSVNVAVAYTEYGRREAQKVSSNRNIKVLPHGVNREHFHPLTLPPRPFPITLAGRKFFEVSNDRFLMMTVSAMNRRKDLTRSLQLLKALRERGVDAYWFLHTFGDVAVCDGVDLRSVGRQLKLEESEHWTWTGAVVPELRGLNPEEINGFYNCADLLLSTTLGEGWGLPITEALAAGCPVAAPAHTSVAEIFEQLYRFNTGRFLALPTEPHGGALPGDNTRLRPRVAVDAAADLLAEWIKNPKPRRALNAEAKKWLDWDRIAGAWKGYFFDELDGVDAILRRAGGQRMGFGGKEGGPGGYRPTSADNDLAESGADNFKSSTPEANNAQVGVTNAGIQNAADSAPEFEETRNLEQEGAGGNGEVAHGVTRPTSKEFEPAGGGIPTEAHQLPCPHPTAPAGSPFPATQEKT